MAISQLHGVDGSRHCWPWAKDALPHGLVTSPACWETLDKFAKKFVEVLQEDPDVLHNAPVTTKVRRVDEVYAARNLTLSYPFDE